MSNTGHQTKSLYRPETLKFLPKDAKAVLDVGCANGEFGYSVKKDWEYEEWGILDRTRLTCLDWTHAFCSLHL
jgi:hypothetical protein